MERWAIAIQGTVQVVGFQPLCVRAGVAVAPAADGERLLAAMRAHPKGRNAAIIAEIVAEHRGMVAMRSLVGGQRVVTMLAGEQLPRIC
jgi:hydrogenase expression/formation protein HypE